MDIDNLNDRLDEIDAILKEEKDHYLRSSLIAEKMEIVNQVKRASGNLDMTKSEQIFRANVAEHNEKIVNEMFHKKLKAAYYQTDNYEGSLNHYRDLLINEDTNKTTKTLEERLEKIINESEDKETRLQLKSILVNIRKGKNLSLDQIKMIEESEKPKQEQKTEDKTKVVEEKCKTKKEKKIDKKEGEKKVDAKKEKKAEKETEESDEENIGMEDEMEEGTEDITVDILDTMSEEEIDKLYQAMVEDVIDGKKDIDLDSVAEELEMTELDEAYRIRHTAGTGKIRKIKKLTGSALQKRRMAGKKGARKGAAKRRAALKKMWKGPMRAKLQRTMKRYHK